MTSDHRTCSVDGCDLRVRCRNWCNTHYRRWLAHGDPLHYLKMSDGGACSVDSCDGPVVGRGWCRRHYSRWYKRGSIIRATADRGEACSVHDCTSPVQARGWCITHYNRWRLHGDPMHYMPRTRGACTIDGCDETTTARGWCNRHYSRWLKHGDPLTATNGKALDDLPTSLYRLWDCRGVLLYIGITIDVDRRFAEHCKSSEWWPCVEWIGIESFSTRAEAMTAERAAIRNELPAHNRVHMPAA